MREGKKIFHTEVTKVRKDDLGDTTHKTRVKMLDLIRENNKLTLQKLAEILKITVKGIDWNIAKLKEGKKLERVGPAKGGQ